MHYLVYYVYFTKGANGDKFNFYPTNNRRLQPAQTTHQKDNNE